MLAGGVFNDSPYRVTGVRLQVDGFNAERHPLSQTFTWALGDIAAGGETSFTFAAMPGAVAYWIDVASFDLVSRDRAP